MSAVEQPGNTGVPLSSFHAAAAALDTIREAVRTARGEPYGHAPDAPPAGAEEALAALLLLRQLRDELADWEPGLIETARDAGASWADLAHPLGVASRQAAERRYLRVRPGAPGSTGEQRVQATRDHRAADRSVSAWARGNAGDLRRLAGQITSLTDLPADASAPVARLAGALAADDAAALIAPLAGTHAHLQADHPGLAARVETITRHTERLREDTGEQRRGG